MEMGSPNLLERAPRFVAAAEGFKKETDKNVKEGVEDRVLSSAGNWVPLSNGMKGSGM